MKTRVTAASAQQPIQDLCACGKFHMFTCSIWRRRHPLPRLLSPSAPWAPSRTTTTSVRLPSHLPQKMARAPAEETPPMKRASARFSGPAARASGAPLTYDTLASARTRDKTCSRVLQPDRGNLSSFSSLRGVCASRHVCPDTCARLPALQEASLISGVLRPGAPPQSP